MKIKEMKINCPLCDSINQKYRLIKKTKHSFCIICKSPLKDGHVMVLPKRHVTQTEFSCLTPEESKDLLSLMEEMQNHIHKIYDENTIIVKNGEGNSTQAHLHFHILPSKNGLRDFLSKLEGVPHRKDISTEKYIKIKEKLLNGL